MRFNTVLGMVMALGFILLGLALPAQRLPAAESISSPEKAKDNKNKKEPIHLDVIIEEVDYAANTITVRSTIHVVPPHDHVGGMVFMTGTTDSRKDKTTKFVRLPVMPEANLKGKKPKVGLHVMLRVEMLKHGALVVVGIDEFKEAERIGVDWLDAPGTKEGR